MKKSIFFVAVLVAVLSGCRTWDSLKTDESFTIATFNVRCETSADKGEKAWYRRLPDIAEVVRSRGFDIFGVQEMMSGEAKIIAMELPDYERIGRGREADGHGEAMYIYYATNRFECLESGTFWLSETPDVPGSQYTGAGCPRSCTWGRFRDLRNGAEFRYFNTHLDHVSSKARWDGMQVLLERGVRPAKARGETVFLSGDLNETLDPIDDAALIARYAGPRLSQSPEDNPIALVSSELVDTLKVSATPHRGTFRTFNGFHIEPRCRIDYIYSTPNVKVLAHETVNDRPNGRLPSDHYPVAAIVEVK